MKLNLLKSRVPAGVMFLLLSFVPNNFFRLTPVAAAQAASSHCVPVSGALMTNIGAIAGVTSKVDQAPHLVITVVMRGLLRGLATRAYFPNEPQLATDSILQLVDPARRSTLMLQPSPAQAGLFNWEIRMQGSDETVFFDF